MLFSKNKNLKKYWEIIKKAKMNVPQSGEIHHIIPKSFIIDGFNHEYSKNKIKLSYKDHAKCHLLLFDFSIMFKQQMMEAAWLMMNTIMKGQQIDFELFGTLRMKKSKQMSKQMSKIMSNTVYCYDVETKKNVRVSKDEFHKCDKYVHKQKGMITAKNILTGLCKNVSQNEFYSNDEWITPNTGRKLSEDEIKKRTETRRKNGGFEINDKTRIKKSESMKKLNHKWYKKDGEKNIKVKEGTQPEGFVLGRNNHWNKGKKIKQGNKNGK